MCVCVCVCVRERERDRERERQRSERIGVHWRRDIDTGEDCRGKVTSSGGVVCVCVCSASPLIVAEVSRVECGSGTAETWTFTGGPAPSGTAQEERVNMADLAQGSKAA